jgi:hypothetical protein
VEAFRKAQSAHGKHFSTMAARGSVPDKPVGSIISFYFRRRVLAQRLSKYIVHAIRGRASHFS